MKTIEIDTSQKVTIQYELASVGNRFLAFFIDALIIMGVQIFLGILASQTFDSGDGALYFFIFIMVPFFIFYTLASESLMDGQTLGKKAIGIKVVKLNGDAGSGHDYFMRWVFRFVDIYISMGSVAALLISASPQSQRVGGILSGTTVIRTNSSRSFSLRDILRISTIETYTPSYTWVRQFAEEDMLFIKKVLERERKYSNPAHRKALNALAQHIAALQEMEQAPKDPRNFLKTLINDYIVLTR